METLDPDESSLPDPGKTPNTYEKLEREAIQSESTAPESATKFPFGHNADGGPEQIASGLDQGAGGVIQTPHDEGGTAVGDNENSETVRDPSLLGPDCE